MFEASQIRCLSKNNSSQERIEMEISPTSHMLSAVTYHIFQVTLRLVTLFHCFKKSNPTLQSQAFTGEAHGQNCK